MKFVVGLLAISSVVWGQSPHVFRGNKNPRLDVQVHQLSIGGATKLSSNGSTELYQPLNAFSKRQGTEPTPEEQEGRRPPLFPMPSCFWCPTEEEFNGDGWALLAKFTTDEFQRRTRAQASDLRDTCMFYTKPIHTPPDALSRQATQLACKYEKYSIWVSTAIFDRGLSWSSSVATE